MPVWTAVLGSVFDSYPAIATNAKLPDVMHPKLETTPACVLMADGVPPERYKHASCILNAFGPDFAALLHKLNTEDERLTIRMLADIVHAVFVMVTHPTSPPHARVSRGITLVVLITALAGGEQPLFEGL